MKAEQLIESVLHESFGDAWYHDDAYDDLLGSIPKDLYSKYDSLVHGGWTTLIRAVDNWFRDSEYYSLDRIYSNYEANLKEASRIPGAKAGVRYAKKNALRAIKRVVSRAQKLQAELEAIREQIYRMKD